ncbi:MAG: hypothetical protein GC193_09885 [Cryomorphaceae bacterium]|nr:hypothetical protein [Cryomorphaceae bacterium]
MTENSIEVGRLIIVGNGFDIAHGLKSSYKDFLHDYCQRALLHAAVDKTYDDCLLSIGRKALLHHESRKIKSLSKEEAFNFLNSEAVTTRFNNPISWKSDFIKDTITDLARKDWVDIECIYFRYLKDYASLGQFDNIKNLNEQLVYIKGKLISYLTTATKTFDRIDDPGLVYQFKEIIKKEECVNQSLEYDLKWSGLFGQDLIYKYNS